jgi:hypothetical protein
LLLVHQRFGAGYCCAGSAAQKIATVAKTQDDIDLRMVVEKDTPWEQGRHRAAGPAAKNRVAVALKEKLDSIMPKNSTGGSMITRRSFLVASGLTALASTRVFGANDRLRIGVIGAGERMKWLLN